MMLLLVAGFIIVNFLGYQMLAQRRAASIAQQRSLRFDIQRLKELQDAKPAVDVTSQWLDAHLPAYKDIDQLETHLFNVVTNKAVSANLELNKKDPRPTQKDALVHRSIMEIETTASMENLVTFIHSLQNREDFRFISFLELTPTKDEERVRCQARVEQWWRPDSELVGGALDSDVPTLPVVPLAAPPAVAAETGTETATSAEESAGSTAVEQSAASEVQSSTTTTDAAPAAPETTPAATETTPAATETSPPATS
jgi:Tfp pilus assembly protein PilO